MPRLHVLRKSRSAHGGGRRALQAIQEARGRRHLLRWWVHGRPLSGPTLRPFPATACPSWTAAEWAHAVRCAADGCPTDRLLLLDVFRRAWAARVAGTPRPGSDQRAPCRAAALARMLSLKRVCRSRRRGASGHATEAVEPFGRAIVMYL